MKRVWVFVYSLLLMECCLVSAARIPPASATTGGGGGGRYRRAAAESTVPIPTLSPREGNTTFLGGTTWCVARPGALLTDVQRALDWACGPGDGAADCSPVQVGGACYEPDTLLGHASYAFNSYYQQNGNSDVACNFGGTAALTTRDPSYGSCKFLSSGPVSAAPLPVARSSAAWVTSGTQLLLYLVVNRRWRAML